MESGFPTGLTVSLNGKKPVYDETPQPIILSLTTGGRLSGHHFLDRSHSNDLLITPEEFPSGNIKDLIGVNVSSVKNVDSSPIDKGL